MLFYWHSQRLIQKEYLHKIKWEKKNENITVYEMTQVILLINEKAQELFNSVIKGSHTQQIKKNLSNTHKTQVPKIQFKDPYSDTSEI